MLVLIDESGDPGFKIVKGSSSHFVVAMVIFDDLTEAQRTSAAIELARQQLRVKASEFKFANSHANVRDGFFQAVCGFKFRVRAVVVDKASIYSEHLRANTDSFYNYFLKQLLEHNGGTLRDAIVKIDGSGDRAFRKALNTYLRQQLSPGTVRKVTFKDSCSDNLLQLADMCVGAVRCSHGDKSRYNDQWTHMLRCAKRIDDIWRFR